MTEQPIGNIDEFTHERGRNLAELAIKVADILGFIRAWNNGDADTSVIASVDHLHNALTFDEDRCRKYDRMCRQAQLEGSEVDFLLWFSVLTTPTICASLVQSLIVKSRAWAVEALKGDPVALDAPVPFADGDTLVRWVLASLERPPFAGPAGETILDADAEEHLLRMALDAEMPTALRDGWLQLPDGSNTTRSGHVVQAGRFEA